MHIKSININYRKIKLYLQEMVDAEVSRVNSDIRKPSEHWFASVEESELNLNVCCQNLSPSFVTVVADSDNLQPLGTDGLSTGKVAHSEAAVVPVGLRSGRGAVWAASVHGPTRCHQLISILNIYI